VVDARSQRSRGQFFNVFNHPNFGLPSLAMTGILGKPSTRTGCGALTYTTVPPTGLLGISLGGDSSPPMIAFQARVLVPLFLRFGKGFQECSKRLCTVARPPNFLVNVLKSCMDFR
jgi:hypothetical protein